MIKNDLSFKKVKSLLLAIMVAIQLFFERDTKTIIRGIAIVLIWISVLIFVVLAIEHIVIETKAGHIHWNDEK